MKEFKLRFTADVADIEAQFKGAASELKKFAAGVASAENQLEALQQTGAYLTQMDKQLAELKKKYPDIFNKIFGNVDAQMKAALEPLAKSFTEVGKTVKKIGDQLSGIASGKVEATNTEMKKLGETVAALAKTMGMQTDLDFLNGTDKARLKAQKLIDVLSNLAVAYYKLDKASDKTDLGSLSSKGSEQEKPKRTKKKSTSKDSAQSDIKSNKEVAISYDELFDKVKRFRDLQNSWNAEKDIAKADKITNEMDKAASAIKKSLGIDGKKDRKLSGALSEIFNKEYESIEEIMTKIADLVGDRFPKITYDEIVSSVDKFMELQDKMNNPTTTNEEYAKFEQEADDIVTKYKSINAEVESIFNEMQYDLSRDSAIEQLANVLNIDVSSTGINEISDQTAKAAEAARLKAEEEEKARIASEAAAETARLKTEEAEKARLAAEAEAKAAKEAAEAARLQAEEKERAIAAAKQLKEIKDTEAGAFYDSKTGKLTKITKGSKDSVSTSLDDYQNASKNGYDTRIHSHLWDVAAPSISSKENDFNAWLQVFDYIKKQAIVANKEILTFDFSSLTKETLQEIANKYKELTKPIVEDFEHPTPEKVQKWGGYGNVDEEMQRQLREALEIVMKDYSGVMSSVPIINSNQADSINAETDAIQKNNEAKKQAVSLTEQYRNANEEVKRLVGELAKLDDLDETDEIAHKWERLAEIAPGIYSSIMHGGEWDQLKQEILGTTSAVESAGTAIENVGTSGTAVEDLTAKAEAAKTKFFELTKSLDSDLSAGKYDEFSLGKSQAELDKAQQELKELADAGNIAADVMEEVDAAYKKTSSAISASYEGLRNENMLKEDSGSYDQGYLDAEKRFEQDKNSYIQEANELRHQVESLEQQLAQVKKQSTSGTGIDTQSEIEALKRLENKIFDVKHAVEEKIKAFVNEGKAVDSNVTKEIAALDNLLNKINEIKSAVDSKTAAFKTEGNAVSNSVKQAAKQKEKSTNGKKQEEVSARSENEQKINAETKAQEAFKQKVIETMSVVSEYIDKLKIANKTQEESASSNKMQEFYNQYEDSLSPSAIKQKTELNIKNALKQIGGLSNPNPSIGITGKISEFSGSDTFERDYAKLEAYKEMLEKIGYTLSEPVFNKQDGILSAKIVPIDGKAITDLEQARKILEDIYINGNSMENPVLPDYIQKALPKLQELKEKLSSVTNQDELKAWKQEWDEVVKSISQAKKEQEGLALSSQKIILNGMKNSLAKAYKGASIDIEAATDEQKAFVQSYEELSSKLAFYAKNRRILSNDEISALEKEVKAVKDKANAYAQQVEAQKKAENIYGTKEIKSAQSKKESITGIATSDRFANSQEVEQRLSRMNAAYDALIAKQKEFKPGEETEDDRVAFQRLTDEFNKSYAALNELINSSDRLNKNARWSKSLNPGVDVSTSDKMKAVLEGAIRSSEKGKIKIGDLRETVRELDYSVQNQNGSWSHFTAKINDTGTAIVGFNAKAKQTDGIFKSLFTGASRQFKQAIARFTGFDVFYRGINEIKKGIQYVKEIDSALTELKKVTDETDASYAQFLQTMSKTGSEIGATVANLTNMAANWARLGYSMEEAGNLAKSTAVLLNVSEFTDAEKASEALISTIQAYGYAAEDSMHVVDVLNEIGNNFAISSDGIATALQDSASSLMAAGNNLEQSVAMVAAANKVLQDPNSVGSALRTISLRIRGTSVKVLEEMGEETDGVIESVSKLQAKIKGLTGVNILNDAGGYKDTYTIIKEIAEVWPELDDMNKAATLELLAGKNRSNAMAAMLTNIEDLTAAYEDAMEAEGSAIAENEKYLDSIQGRIDQFTNAVQTMWNNAIGSNVVKMVVSLGTELIKLVDTLGLIPSALAAIAAVKFVKNVSIPAVKESITAVKQVFDEARGVVSTLSSFSGEGLVGFLNGKVDEESINKITKALGSEIIAHKNLSQEKARQILLDNGVQKENIEGTLSAMGYSSANGVLSLSFKELALSIKEAAIAFFSSPFGMAVAAVASIALIVGVVDLLTESFDEAKDKLDEAKEEIKTNEQELKSLNSELEETKERIDELNSKDKLTVVEEEELKKLKEQNAQLKTQIGILEERDKYLKSEAAEKARNLYSKDKRVQGSNQSNMPTYAAGAGATGLLVGNTFVTDSNIPQAAAVSWTSTTGENYTKSQLMLQVDNYKKAQKKYQEAIDAANKDSNDQNMKNMETARKNLEDAGSKLNETMQGIANDYADIEWNDSTKEFLKPIYDQLDQARIAVDTSGEAILTAFNRIASQSDFENEVKNIEETAGLTGEALQEMLSFNDDGTLDTAAGGMNLFVQSLIDCGVISDTSAESLQKVVDLTLTTSENASDAAVANQKLARSQKMLQYYKLYKELNQYTKKLKNTYDSTGKLTDQYKEQISSIRQKMSVLAQEISQYDILSEQINEAKSSFEEFENAQTTDEDNAYVDKTSEMFKTLIDGFQTTNVGSEAFKSAFKSLIPKEVYDAPDTLVEKYDAAAKYISETLSKYFKIEYDDDGIIESVEVTSSNINKFAEDARDKGLIELSDDGVWTVLETDFKKFAEQMGITEEMLVAIGTQMDKMDADWIMGDTTSFFDSFDMDAQTNIYRAVKNLALLEAQMEDGMVKTDEEKEAWAKSYAEYTKIISDNSKEAVASIEEYNAATAKVDEASAKVDEAKAKLEALKNSGASETEIKIAEGELTTLVEDLTSALAKKNELTAPDEMLITIAQDYLTGQLDTLQTQLLTREWFITPTIKDDGTIESDLFELGEDGKYKIKSGVEIPDEDKALVEQYIEVLNGIKTVSVFFKDENDAQGKADKLQTTAENIDEVLNSLKAQIDVSDAISALEELKTEIDSLKNIKVNVTTEKKTGFWDWLTGGSNHVNTTPQRNTSNGRQNIKLQGTANATGDWGLSQDERNSLVGELGQELVVDPKTGKYYTVGDNGAEFVDLPKDAIIFNHKQTAEIFKNGHINTRGQAYAEGNAHVGTSGTFLTKYGLAAAYGGSVPNYQGYSDVLQHLDTISDTVDDASSDSKDDFEELFDWFEVLVNELDQSIDLITAKIDNTVGANAKNSLYQQVIDLNYAKMAALNKGIELYSGKAQEFLNQIPQAYKEMAQNGAVALTDFQGEANEKVVEAIKNYREGKDKAADLNVELENIKKNISDINVQMLEAIETEYENKIGLITNLNDRIQKAMDLQEESGERLSANYYNEMIKNAQEALKLQRQQRKEMQAQLDQSVANGDVERYSEDWYNMVNAINNVDEAIVQSEIDIESFQNAINELHWENFERLIKSIENVSDEAEHLRNLIKDDDITDDVGNWTEAGITALGLVSQEMENAKYRAELYGKEIEQLKKDYKAGLYSQDEYNDKLQELKSSQWDAIDAYESAKDAIVDLNKTRIEAVKDGIQKEIDAYEKLIDKRKEDLDAQKDQHDWAKTVKEHTSEIDSIQRQIDALNGDTSASAEAQRKKLQEELAKAQEELEETYYDREIEMQQKALDETLELYKGDKEKKMEELDEYLKHEEQVIADSYELVLSNSEVVYTRLNEMAKEYNIEILNSVVDPWNQSTAALGTYGESLELATSGYVAQLKLIEDELTNIQNQADATARSLIAMANAQSSQIINSGTSSKPSSSGKTSTPASKPSSTTSGKPSVGQTVTVKTSATNWSRDGGNGTRIYSFVKGNSYTVKQVSGNEVLIGTSSGYTGWINKKDLIGYAKGTTGVKKNGPAVIDENGLEEIVMHTKGGKVAYLTKGTSVLPHDISENLMKLGSVDYRALLDRNKPKVGAPYVVNNDIELNLNVGEVIHVEHMDNDSLPEIQDAIQKQLDSYIKRMNNGVRKYAR